MGNDNTNTLIAFLFPRPIDSTSSCPNDQKGSAATGSNQKGGSTDHGTLLPLQPQHDDDHHHHLSHPLNERRPSIQLPKAQANGPPHLHRSTLSHRHHFPHPRRDRQHQRQPRHPLHVFSQDQPRRHHPALISQRHLHQQHRPVHRPARLLPSRPVEFLRRLQWRGHHLLQPHKDAVLVQPGRNHSERTARRREHHPTNRGHRRA